MTCDTVTGSSPQSFNVSGSSAAAQYIRPTFPAGTTDWAITRAKLYLTRTSGNSKTLSVSIRTADANLAPTSTILASSTALTSGALNASGGWAELSLPVSGLLPTQGICIVIEPGSGGGDCNVQYLQSGTAQPFNTHFMSSANGTTWTSPTDTKDMRFVLTGTYTTMVEP
jgi:hypothetical protein